MPRRDPWKAALNALFALQQKVARYFPTERGQPMVHGALSLALSSVRTTETHVERVLSLQFRDQSLKRSLVHLHFPTWPELCVCCPGWLGAWGVGGGERSRSGLTQRSSPTVQRTARQPQQLAALHPGGACALPAPAAPAHADCCSLQVGCEAGDTARGSSSERSWPHTCFPLQLRGGPHGSLRVALCSCAGGGGGEQAP